MNENTSLSFDKMNERTVNVLIMFICYDFTGGDFFGRYTYFNC